MKKIKNTFLAFFVTVLTSLNLVLPTYAEETTAQTVNTAGFSVNVVGDGTVTLSSGDFTKTLSDGESFISPIKNYSLLKKEGLTSNLVTLL